jgi:hypothetical protein
MFYESFEGSTKHILHVRTQFLIAVDNLPTPAAYAKIRTDTGADIVERVQESTEKYVSCKPRNESIAANCVESSVKTPRPPIVTTHNAK